MASFGVVSESESIEGRSSSLLTSCMKDEVTSTGLIAESESSACSGNNNSGVTLIDIDVKRYLCVSSFNVYDKHIIACASEDNMASCKPIKITWSAI